MTVSFHPLLVVTSFMIPLLGRLWIQFTASEERRALKVPPTRVKLDRDSGA